MKAVRIIGYARESTRDQALHGFNLDDQVKKINSYIDLYYEGQKIDLEIIREEGASAKSLDRPRMKEIIKRIKSGEIDVLIIHNLDRLTRQVRDLATLLEVFEAHDVKLISITEKIDTKTPMGRFFIYLIVLIAQWEWETIRSRTLRGIDESARQGNYPKPSAPFGYKRRADDHHKLEIDPEKAAVVRRIFESMVYNLDTFDTIVRQLNAENVLNTRWTKQRVVKISKNRIYYGTLILHGVEYPDHVPAIIDKELFDRINNTKVFRGNRTRKNRFVYLFKGLITCTKCDRIMATTPTYGHTKNYFYYECHVCRTRINADEVNKAVFPLMTELMKEKKYLEDLEQVKAVYQEIADVLGNIPVESIISEKEYSAIEHHYSQSKEDIKKIDWCVRALKANLDVISFNDLPFLEQKEFIIKNIDRIIFDRRNKEISVIPKKSDSVKTAEIALPVSNRKKKKGAKKKT